ncbi:MAG: tetratricopeptide repeat protein [Kiritimatiellae bacterium]|nr:tetratricopeptide repeat protein [Kiritimatiellia bacterium]
MNDPTDSHTVYSLSEPGGTEYRHAQRREIPHRRFPRGWLVPMLMLLVMAATVVVTMAVMSYRDRSVKPEVSLPDPAQETPAEPTPPASASVEITRLMENARIIRDLKIQVDLLQGRGLYAEAAEKVRRQRAVMPDSTELKVLLGRLYFRTGRLDDAIRLLLDALKDDPGVLGARLDLANALLSRGDHAGALAAARWLLEATPSVMEAHLIAARAALAEGWYDRALEHLREAVDLRPMDMEARNMLALTYLRQGAHARAISHLQDIIKAGAADHVTYYNLAVCYAQKHQPEDTARVLIEASEDLGADQVAPWMEADDFAPVQPTELFKNARMQILNSVAQSTRVQMISPKTDTGLGIMPMMENRYRQIELK